MRRWRSERHPSLVAKSKRVLKKTAAGARGIAVLVGPEGDFAPEEVATAIDAGAHAGRLGPTTLRAETATMYALSVVSAYLAAR